MYQVFLGALFIVILILLVLHKEDFSVIRRAIRPVRTYSSQPIRRTSSPPLRTYSGRPVRRITAPQTIQRRGFPLGPAVANPYQTGVVQGSLLAPLQMQYRQIFTPRSTATVGSGASRVSMVSGQPQRRQHLQPGGLGHTGWIYRRP